MAAETRRVAQRGTWTGLYPLLLFFVLAYAITIAATLALDYLPGVPAEVWLVTRILSPTIAAVILSAALGGSGGVKALLAGFLRWRVGLRWYVAASALLWLPLLMALVYALLGYTAPGMAPGMTLSYLLVQVAFTFYSGPIVEEAGWRGFALPRLQERFSALTSSLILGVVWAAWHLPFYATSGGGAGIPFPAYAALVTVLTIYFTWVYNNTRGSLVLCVLAHFSFNAASAFVVNHLGLLPRMVFNIGASVGLTLIVVAVVLYFGPKRLMRQGSA
jgi:membrane protease YdiL (CAAX protease family)